MVRKMAIGAAALLSVVGLGVAPVASAAPTATASAAVGCTGAGCHSKDPVAMGCVADSWVRASGYAEADGVVELRYSPACDAVWGRVLYSRPGAPLAVSNDNGTLRTTVPAGATTTVTPMLQFEFGSAAWSGSAWAMDW